MVPELAFESQDDSINPTEILQVKGSKEVKGHPDF